MAKDTKHNFHIEMPTQLDKPSTNDRFHKPFSPTIFEVIGKVNPDYPVEYVRSNLKDLHSIHKFLKKQFFKVRYGLVQQLIIFSFSYFLLMCNLFEDSELSWIGDLKKAWLMSSLQVLYIGCLVLPKPSANWPSTRIWRLINSATLVYLLNLVFLMFFSKANLSWILQNILDPNLKHFKQETDYGSDCRLYTPENPVSSFYNIISSVDEYFLAHFVGWLVRAFIFRNMTMLWIFGIGFELIELTFYPWLPNFNECWWDSLLFDLFGANFLGILLGLAIMRYKKMSNYNWFIDLTPEESKNLSLYQKFKLFLEQRKTYQKTGRWHILASPSNFFYVLWYIFQNYMFDMSHFFNKYNQKISSTSCLLGFRVFTIGFFFLSMCGDYMEFIQSKRQIPMRISIFLGHLVIFSEWIMYFKYLDFSQYEGTIPLVVKLCWFLLFCVIGIIMLGLVIEQICCVKNEIPTKSPSAAFYGDSFAIMDEGGYWSRENSQQKIKMKMN